MIKNSNHKLAIFIPSMRVGGAERAMLKLAAGLADERYDVDLVLAQKEGPHLAEVPSSVRLIDLKASRVLTSLPALTRYLRRERPSVLLSVMNHANIVALWARRLACVSTRVIVSERNTISEGARNATDLSGRLMPRLAKRYYRWADGIHAVSHGVADDLSHVTGIPRNQIQVIYNPIVTPELHQRAEVPLEHPWFADGQPPVILSVGRFRPQKDFGTLIQAFAQVRHGREARLLILGDGPERDSLEQLVKTLDLHEDVDLPGFDANPYRFMSRAALFVLSSRWEGLPGVLIEAMGCGASVVATDCPSGPKEILRNGQHGPLVPVGDVQAMARAIERSLDGRVPSLPSEGKQPFELQTVVSQFANLMFPEAVPPA